MRSGTVSMFVWLVSLVACQKTVERLVVRRACAPVLNRIRSVHVAAIGLQIFLCIPVEAGLERVRPHNLGEGVGDGGRLRRLAEGVLAVDAAVEVELLNPGRPRLPAAFIIRDLIAAARSNTGFPSGSPASCGSPRRRSPGCCYSRISRKRTRIRWSTSGLNTWV